jgi:hypothetical protein
MTMQCINGEIHMDNPAGQELPIGQQAARATQVTVPDMPPIRGGEQYQFGLPFVLVDGLPKTIG